MGLAGCRMPRSSPPLARAGDRSAPNLSPSFGLGRKTTTKALPTKKFVRILPKSAGHLDKLVKLCLRNTLLSITKKPARGVPLTGLSPATSPQLLRWRSRGFGLVALLGGCRRCTRLSLHCGFVNHGTLFQLPTAQIAFGNKVEVSSLTLGTALPRRDAAGIGLVGPIRGQVVLDVD